QALDDLREVDRALRTGDEASTPGGARRAGDMPRAGETVVAQAQFRVTRLHARGGLGEVYVAADEQMGRDVALKGLQPPRAGAAASRRRCLREARLTGRLQHPGIVPVYGSGLDGAGVPFYVMRLIGGRTLQEAVQDHHGPSRPASEPAHRVAFQQLLRRYV